MRLSCSSALLGLAAAGIVGIGVATSGNAAVLGQAAPAVAVAQDSVVPTQPLAQPVYWVRRHGHRIWVSPRRHPWHR